MRDMKKPYLTLEGIRHAVKFLEKRKAYAKESGNEDWVTEYDNVLRIIRSLCALDLEKEKINPKGGDHFRRMGTEG
jgi:hypothetical protein